MINELLYTQNYGNKENYYLVKPGDTIWKIARDFTGKGMNYVQLEDTNQHVRDLTKIKPGDCLIIPKYWEKMKKLNDSDVFANPNDFAHAAAKILLDQWIDYNRFNSSEALKSVQEQGKLLSRSSTINNLEKSGNGLTALAIYWVLLCRFESVFHFSLQETKHHTFLKIGTKYFDINNIEGKDTPNGFINMNGEIPYVDKLCPFNKIVDKHINESNLENVRKIAGFCNKFGLLQIPAVDRIFNM